MDLTTKHWVKYDFASTHADSNGTLSPSTNECGSFHGLTKRNMGYLIRRHGEEFSNNMLMLGI